MEVAKAVALIGVCLVTWSLVGILIKSKLYNRKIDYAMLVIGLGLLVLSYFC